ncbi:hypothetical protein E2C01_100939 [Portunus trituberculatus]|uniref:Uncharacterized protein n=1 Tax=Portunus trituberculatus TaxID=210409 RepID=A0A5B7KIT2_PORTR|nr:hypothetical protein [Portunus trituberculatus]
MQKSIHTQLPNLMETYPLEPLILIHYTSHTHKRPQDKAE